MELDPVEQYLWQCARLWRSPAQVLPPAGLDWARVVTLGVKNRMQTLLEEVFTATGAATQLPPAAAQTLQKGIAKYERNADHLGRNLRGYLRYAAALGQEVVVMKGLWLSLKIYGKASMRPGGDIDVLLRRRDIPDSLRILEEKMGYGRWWRPLLDDRYYKRHHLHQQRCNADRSIWFEPHWLLDHPYTRLTIDYEAMMDRTTPGELWGEPIRELSLPDLLLSLAIHLVKHAVYLPSVVERPDLPRLILADGMLVYFVDVAEVLKRYADEIDWPLTVALAWEGGAVDILGAVLRVCCAYLAAPVPNWVLTALPLVAADWLTSWLMQKVADYEIATYQGKQPGGWGAFLLGYQETAVFRPIRLLDFLHYLLPGEDYLRRCYGRETAVTAAVHVLRVLGQYARVSFDTVYYAQKRKREVAMLDGQGAVWPELPVEP